MRGALLFGAGALMLSHWLALVLTARGLVLSLLTLQSAGVPWETWSVIPLSWLVLMFHLPLQTTDDKEGFGRGFSSARAGGP